MVGALKRLARPAVEMAIAAVGPDRWPSRHSRLVVLTYHRVLPKSDPEWDVEQPGMLVTPETLRMQLETVRRRFELVYLDEWIDAAKAGRALPGLACAVTFDDGWRDNYDHAFPVLRELGLPATIFLVTDRIGTNQAFWPNRLARLIRRWPGRIRDAGLTEEAMATLKRLGLEADCEPARLSREAINEAIEAAKYDTDAGMGEFLGRLESALGVAADDRRDLLDWVEVREMKQSGLVRFGSHTCNHTRLVEGLDEGLIEREIEGSRTRLEGELGGSPGLFCYPNGDCSPAALARVRACYAGAVSTQAGWNDERSDPYTLKRIGLHEDVTATPRGFRARLTGWL